MFSAIMSTYMLACGGGNQISDNPTEATKTVAAKSEIEPSPAESSDPKPIKQLAPQPKPTKVLPTSIPDTNRTTYELNVSDIPSSCKVK